MRKIETNTKRQAQIIIFTSWGFDLPQQNNDSLSLSGVSDALANQMVAKIVIRGSKYAHYRLCKS